MPLFVDEAVTFLNQVYERADAFLFGRRTYEIFAGSWGTWPDPGEIILFTYPVIVGQGRRLFPDAGPDTALELVDSRAASNGITLQVYRPGGRPRYATATAD